MNLSIVDVFVDQINLLQKEQVLEYRKIKKWRQVCICLWLCACGASTVVSCLALGPDPRPVLLHLPRVLIAQCRRHRHTTAQHI